MSVAPLVQLMSRGKQNDILNDNPQITFWRYRHMKYTDFALDHVNLTGDTGNTEVCIGPMVFDIPRSGDLVNDCFAQIKLPGLANVVEMDQIPNLRHIGDKANQTPASNWFDPEHSEYTLDGSHTNVGHPQTAGPQQVGVSYEYPKNDNTVETNGGQSNRAMPIWGASPTPPGTLIAEDGEHTNSNVHLKALDKPGDAATEATIGLVRTATGFNIPTIDPIQGPDPFNTTTYYDCDARCMRPNTLQSLDTSSRTHNREEVVNYRATSRQHIGGVYEFVENKKNIQCYHLASRAVSQTAMTIPGPQPYWCNGVGQAILKEIKLRVGSQYVETLYSDYLYMWDELSDKPGRDVSSQGYGQMSMKGTAEQRKVWSRTESTVYVPIPLFFMRTSGNALPLIALQFHGVQIVLECEDPTKLIINHHLNKERDGIAHLGTNNNNTLSNCWTQDANVQRSMAMISNFRTVVRPGRVDPRTGCYRICTAEEPLDIRAVVSRKDCHVSLLVGFVYLNVTERNKFADASFEMLIDQVQKHTDTDIRQQHPEPMELQFNHMVQELIWACKRKSDLRYEPFNYIGSPDFINGRPQDFIKSVQLRLNNSPLFNMNSGEEVASDYFRTVEPFLHHTRIPNNFIYSYSFALNPESEQPSGAINMSRVDTVNFSVTMEDALPISNPRYICRDSVTRESLLFAYPNAARPTSLQYNEVKFIMFARNWNVFRITLGLGGVKWAS